MLDDAGDAVGRQLDDLGGVEQPRVALEDPVHLPVAPVGRHGDGVEHGVETGSVAPSGVDRDAKPLGHSPSLSVGRYPDEGGGGKRASEP